MNGISRVLKTIRRLPVSSPVRGELTLDVEFARAFLQWRSPDVAVDSSSPSDLLIDCCHALQLDLICLQSEKGPDNEAELSVNSKKIGRVVDAGLFVFWVVNGPFQEAMRRRGMMAFLTEIARSPAAVDSELWQVADSVTEIMARGIAAGAHGIILADDIAYQQSTYASPDFIEQRLLPIWQALTATAGKLGVPVFFHSDGNLNAVLPMIAAAGFDGLQCMEPAAGMNIRQIKQTYGHKLCLMGNLDPALLCENEPGRGAEDQRDRLKQAVSSLLAAVGDQGGFIFGTCSGLHAGMSPELVHYMYQLVSDLNPASPGGSIWPPLA